MEVKNPLLCYLRISASWAIFTSCIQTPVAIVIGDDAVVLRNHFQKAHHADDGSHETVGDDQCLLALVFTAKVVSAHSEWFLIHLNVGVLRDI